MIKYVYVLVSSVKDYFYEELLISVQSLRYYNKNAYICLLTDNKTADTLVGTRGEVLQYIKEYIKIPFSNNISAKERSRYLKTSMRKYIEGDFWFIDCDTIICDVMGAQACELGMVLDKHTNTTDYVQESIWTNAKKMGYFADWNKKHFNSGVIWVKDTKNTKKFFELWNKLYEETVKNGITIDQTSLNEANCRMKGIITELSGEWNCQVNCGVQYIAGAKVLHYLGYQPLSGQFVYYNKLPFMMADEEKLLSVKNSGKINTEVENIIKNPKKSFYTSVILPNNSITYEIIYSNHMRLQKFIYIKMNTMWRLNEKFLGWIFTKIFHRN